MVLGEIIRRWALKRMKKEEKREEERTTPEEERIIRVAEEHIREVERLYPAAEQIVRKAVEETGDEALRKLYEDFKEYGKDRDYASMYMMVQLAAAIEKGLHRDKDKLFKFLLKAYHRGAKGIAEEVKDPQILKQVAYKDKISNWTITDSSGWRTVGRRIVDSMDRWDVWDALEAIKEDDIKHIAETIDMIFRNYLDWWDKYTYEDLLELREDVNNSGSIEKSRSKNARDRSLQSKIAQWLVYEASEVNFENELASSDPSLRWALSVHKSGLPAKIYVKQFVNMDDRVVMGFNVSLYGLGNDLDGRESRRDIEILLEILKLAYIICPDCIVNLQPSIAQPKSISIMKILYHDNLTRDVVTSNFRKLVNILYSISALYRLRLGISLEKEEKRDNMTFI